MKMFRSTSRSVNKDRLYQSEQEKRQQIHLEKIRIISSSRLLPLKRDSTIQQHLKKAKSAAKLFEQQETKIIQRRENKSLLAKLLKVESSIKPLRMKQSASIQKFYGTSSYWLQKKRDEENIKKQNDLLTKRCEYIANGDIKDIKKKMQSEIKEYLELRDSIRKMKPLRTAESNKRQRTESENKITICLPLFTDSNVYGADNEQQFQQYQHSSNYLNTKINKNSNFQLSKRQDSKVNETPKKDPFLEVKRLRQLKKTQQLNSEERTVEKRYKSVKKLPVQADQLIKRAQNFIDLM